MNLHIKSILIFLYILIYSSSYPQDNKEDIVDGDKVESVEEKDDHYGIISLGYFHPIAIGNNFANEALSEKGGVDFSVLFNLFDENVLFGLKINTHQSDVIDQTLVGNYSESSVTLIGLMLGYHYLMERNWRSHIAIGVGSVTYRNITPGDIFKDSGFSILLEPTIAYQLNKAFGFYLSSAYRQDILNIQTDDAYKSYFNSPKYFNLNLGLRLVI